MLAFLSSVSMPSTVRTTPPNLVLVMLDDLGWADVGFHGSNFPTPAMDELVNGGLELKRLYVNPTCSPTRSAALTGRHPFNMGMQHWTTTFPGSTAALPLDVPTLAEELKAKAGYRTEMVGKWHLGAAKESNLPHRRGFDNFYGILQGATDLYERTLGFCINEAFGVANGTCLPWATASGKSPLESELDDNVFYDFWENSRPVWEDKGTYVMDSYIERVERIIDQAGSTESNPTAEPLFLYFAEQAVHAPLQAPPQPEHLQACVDAGVTGSSSAGNRDMSNRTVLCSMANKVDHSIGRLVEALKKNGMWDNTLVWVLTDNGGMVDWGGELLGWYATTSSSNWPLRGMKTTLFDGGVRAVSFMTGGYLPQSARGQTSSELLHAVDITPTLLALAGVSEADSPPMDGLDAWGAVTTGGTTGRDEIPINIDVGSKFGDAIEDFPANMLIPMLVPNWAPNPRLGVRGGANFSALISWPYKIIVGLPSNAIPADKWGWWSIENYSMVKGPPAREHPRAPVRLYNLEADEGEHNDLSAALPEVVERLMQRVAFYANPDNGFRRPQNNIPRLRANPMKQNWTIGPFL